MAEAFEIEKIVTNEDKGLIQVIPTDVEGECQIEKIQALKFNFGKLIITLILSVFTLGLYAVALTWSVQFRQGALYSDCSLEHANNFYVYNTDKRTNIVNAHRTAGELTFVNKLLKYIFSKEKKAFIAVHFPAEEVSMQSFVTEKIKGLSDEEASKNLLTYGHCEIDIPIEGYCSYALREFTRPFNILQYVGVIVWSAQGNTLFAIMLMISTFILTSVMYFVIRASKMRLKEGALVRQTLTVFRNGDMVNGQQIPNRELVPGDVFVIERGMPVPCDCVLVSGDALMNQASLTGEIIPIGKFQPEAKDDKLSFVRNSTNILYEGTKVVGCSAKAQKYPLAVALRTGLGSFKGQIIRSLLFPAPPKFKFFLQGCYFMLIISIFNILISFAVLGKSNDYGATGVMKFFYFADGILAGLVPPLPTMIGAAMLFALVRLKWQNILGTDAQKMLAAGRVSIVCFDKTGTITDNSIEIEGYEGAAGKQFAKRKENGQIEKDDELIDRIFATCHEAQNIDGKIYGDSVDVKLLEYSNWNIDRSSKDSNICFEVTKDGKKLTVHKIYEFHSNFMSMAVLVSDMNKKCYIYMKGSPEKIESKCIKDIPSGFKDKIANLTIQGKRVLGLAWKEINFNGTNVPPREEVEKDLNYAGLIILENKLKPDSADVIKNIVQAELGAKIISGDNPLTVIKTATEVGILNQTADVFIVGTNDNNDLLIEQLQGIILSESDASQQSAEEKLKFIFELCQGENQIVVTGKALDILYSLLRSAMGQATFYKECHVAHMITQTVTKNDKISQSDSNVSLVKSTIQSLIYRASVFARSRPEQKALVVKELKAMDQHQLIAMVGDGANDCAAIREADIGISFAENDAAFSAPFSSTNNSLKCVQRVLMGGRGAISNASEVFRFYLSCTNFRFVYILMMVYHASYFGELQLTWITYVFSSILLQFFWSLHSASDQMTATRHDTSLVGATTIFSIVGQWVFNVISGIVVLLVLNSQTGYSPTQIPAITVDKGAIKVEYRKESPENTSLFLVFNIIQVLMAFAIYFSKDTKQPIYQNVVFGILLALCLIVNFAIFFLKNTAIAGLKLVELESQFRIQLLLISLGFGFINVIYEEVVIKIILFNRYQKQWRQDYANLKKAILNNNNQRNEQK